VANGLEINLSFFKVNKEYKFFLTVNLIFQIFGMKFNLIFFFLKLMKMDIQFQGHSVSTNPLVINNKTKLGVISHKNFISFICQNLISRELSVRYLKIYLE